MGDQTWTTRRLANMNAGFFGIQFGWGLQMANMSAIYEYLGAQAHELPLLWLAAPLTGLIVQPIVGHFSDRTWTRLGRRRPYFLAGAILSTLALIAMPNATSLWMAATLLWILDTAINISMEPFRAFVADLLPPEQRTRGFAAQSLFIGLGAVVASALPLLLSRFAHVSTVAAPHTVPPSVRLAFYIGAAVYFCAVLWTVVTTPEHPPVVTAAASGPSKPADSGLVLSVLDAVRHMPVTMRQLAGVQVFTWLGLFAMWLYFPVAVAHHVYGATSPGSPAYTEGVAWGGLCFSAYSAVCFLASTRLPALAKRLGKRLTHVLCLACGALGLLSVAVIHSPWGLMLPMAGIGIAWASILSMPYALLADCLPADRTGTYMGLFNAFIVLPEIGASLGFGWVMTHLLHDNRLAAVMAGGISMAIAAILALRVAEPRPADIPERQTVGV
jgi:maltose/moltooligosaccharide transporter